MLSNYSLFLSKLEFTHWTLHLVILLLHRNMNLKSQYFLLKRTLMMNQMIFQMILTTKQKQMGMALKWLALLSP